VDIMMVEELGIIQEEESPVKSALITFSSFVIFGFIPVLTYVLSRLIPSMKVDTFTLSAVLTGLNLIENSSGKHKGKTTISKRGRSRLRSLLFRAIMPLVTKNQEFKKLHEYYTTRKDNPHKKKQSLILLCCKLIRIIYTIMTKQVKYSPEKLVKDLSYLNQREAA
jgi:hypothetical protein